MKNSNHGGQRKDGEGSHSTAVPQCLGEEEGAFSSMPMHACFLVLINSFQNILLRPCFLSQHQFDKAHSLPRYKVCEQQT